MLKKRGGGLNIGKGESLSNTFLCDKINPKTPEQRALRWEVKGRERRRSCEEKGGLWRDVRGPGGPGAPTAPLVQRKGPSPGPVCSLLTAAVRLFCDSGWVWFMLPCCLFFVLFSYLRWCSFRLDFKGFHYPRRKAFIWTFWEGQRNVAFKASRFQI